MNARLLLFTLCCALSISVLAQVTPPVVTPPMPTPVAPPAPPPTPAPPNSGLLPSPAPRARTNPLPPAVPLPSKEAAQPLRERERTIYVPYADLEKIFSDGGKGVFLPYKEFLELWNELNLKRTQEEEAKPPQDGVVSRAEYTARIEGETMVLDAVVTVESFKKGWLTVPLARGGVLPGIAEAQTGTAVLHAKAEGYDVLLPEKGRYELKLKIYAPVRKAGGKQMVTLALPQAAVSRFTAIVPQSGWEFTVNPAAAFTQRPAGADTELSFFFGSGGRYEVAWSKLDAATPLTPLVLASSRVSAEVRAGSLATRAAVDFRILRAPVSSFSFLIPAGQEVLGVTGDDVKDFKLEAAGAQQKVTITPNAPIREKWSVTLALEAPLPKLPADAVVPEITVVGTSQDRGEVNVAAESQLDVTPRPAEGLVQQTQTAPPGQGLSAVAAYRFLKHPAALSLAIAEAKPQVDVDSLTVLTVKRDSNRVEATFHYNIRRVGIFEARIGLPEGWTAWEAVDLPSDSWSVEKTDAAETLVVRFNKQTLGQAQVAIRAQQQRAAPTEDAVVPVFAPQGVARYDAKIGVGVPFSLEVNTKSNGDLRQDDVNEIGATLRGNSWQLSGSNTYTGATTINAGVLNVQQQSQASLPPPDTELTVAFRHRNAVKTPATLSFKAREPQVNVEVLTLVEAREQSLRHTWTLAFNVAYAGTDRFVLAVPKAVADDIRFVDASVKEIVKDYKPSDTMTKALPDAANFAWWEVVLRSERMGAFTLNLSVEKPLPADKAAKLELLPVHVPGAFQETGQVAVVKEDALEIRDYQPENLEEIDPTELHAGLARRGVFLAFKSRAQTVKLALDVTRNAYIPVPQAVVTHAVMTAAISSDRAQTIEMIYWVRNNSQQFLTVKLPKSARLVSDIFVDGATQQPMKREGSDDLLVRLPGGNAGSERSVPVRFVYEIPSEKAGSRMGMMGWIKVEPPQLADVSVVLESHAQLHLPERFDYTSFSRPMEQSLTDRGWGSVRRFFDPLLPSLGPQMNAPVERWKPVPAIPENQKAAFDFKVPEQGQGAKLHRLGAPAAIEVGFRSRKLSWFLEGLAYLIVIIGGIRWLREPLPRKVLAVAVVGLGAVLCTGLLGAANGAIAQAVMLGVLTVAALWIAFALPALWRASSAISPRHRVFGMVTVSLAILLALSLISQARDLPGTLMGLLLFTATVWIMVAVVSSARTRWLKRPAVAGAPAVVNHPVAANSPASGSVPTISETISPMPPVGGHDEGTK